jgi:hypothetical protein
MQHLLFLFICGSPDFPQDLDQIKYSLKHKEVHRRASPAREHLCKCRKTVFTTTRPVILLVICIHGGRCLTRDLRSGESEQAAECGDVDGGGGQGSSRRNFASQSHPRAFRAAGSRMPRSLLNASRTYLHKAALLTYFFTMSFTKAFSPAVREIRILLSQTGSASAGTRFVAVSSLRNAC